MTHPRRVLITGAAGNLDAKRATNLDQVSAACFSPAARLILQALNGEAVADRLWGQSSITRPSSPESLL